MPAITKSWSGARRVGGGASGIGMRWDLKIRIMRKSIQQLQCHIKDLHKSEVIRRLKRIDRKIRLRHGQKDRGEIACNYAPYGEQTDLPARSKHSFTAEDIGTDYYLSFSSLTSTDLIQPTTPF